ETHQDHGLGVIRSRVPAACRVVIPGPHGLEVPGVGAAFVLDALAVRSGPVAGGQAPPSAIAQRQMGGPGVDAGGHQNTCRVVRSRSANQAATTAAISASMGPVECLRDSVGVSRWVRSAARASAVVRFSDPSWTRVPSVTADLNAAQAVEESRPVSVVTSTSWRR